MIILWRSLDLPLIKFKMELHFLWSTKCIISEIDRTSEVNDNPHIISIIAQVLSTLTSNATFQINDAKLYVPVVNFSRNYNIKLLET